MNYGLRIIQNGNVLIDLGTRLGRVIGSIEVTANGSMAVTGFSTGAGFAKVLPTVDVAGVGVFAFPPEATISGTTLSWAYPDSNHRGPAVIVYGVY